MSAFYRVGMALLTLGSGLLLQAQDPVYPPAPPPAQQVIAGEYFVDSDPGFGNGTAISLTPGLDLASLPVTVTTTGLANGVHRVYFRFRNAEGRWGQTAYREFLYDFNPAYPASPGSVTTVERGEYFFDTDPGFGNGLPLSIVAGTDISNLAASLNTTGLAAGIHRVYFRFRSASGHWSQASVKEFLVDLNPAYPAAPVAAGNIVAMEQFIDTDPGFGNGSPVSITPATDIPVSVVPASLIGLSTGTHRHYVRTRNSEGRWSLTSVSTFIYDADPPYPSAPAAPGNIVAAEYFLDADPGFGLGSPIALTPGVDISNLSVNINTSALPDGLHRLYVRSLDDWSLTQYSSFFKGSPLPLTFLRVAAMNRPDWVDLEWRSTHEVNTRSFDIERSADGQAWTQLGSLNARNTGGVHDYTFRDVHPLEGRSLYRLKQVDLDGRFTYSEVLRVNRSTRRMVVSPNPATDKLRVQFTASDRLRHLRLLDASGRLLYAAGITPGRSEVEVSLTHLPSGIYYLVIGDGEEMMRQAITKQ